MIKIPAALTGFPGDWKNLLSHALVGVLLDAVSMFLPINIHIRIAIFQAAIALNLLRRWTAHRPGNK